MSENTSMKRIIFLVICFLWEMVDLTIGTIFLFHDLVLMTRGECAEDLAAAKLILAAQDYFDIHGDAPDDIPYIVDYFADNQDNFAMIANQNNHSRESTATTLTMAKRRFSKKTSNLRFGLAGKARGS